MLVHRHAEIALVALTQKMPVPASIIIERLKNTPAPELDIAFVVCQMTMAHGRPFIDGSNGDTVVVISRGGVAVTAMLRRSWNQAFTADVLRVDEVISWKEQYQ